MVDRNALIIPCGAFRSCLAQTAQIARLRGRPGSEDCTRIDDGEDAARKLKGGAARKRRNTCPLLEEVVGIAFDSRGGEFVHRPRRDEACDGVADRCDSGDVGVFHVLAEAIEVVSGIVDVAQIDSVLEGYEAAGGLAEAASQSVELAVMEPESNFEYMAGGKGLVGDSKQQELSVQLENCPQWIVGRPGGGTASGDDRFGLGTDGAEAVGEVAAALIAGAAANLVGNGAHVGRGVERIKDKVGIKSGFVVEGRADEGTRGSQNVEEGVDDRGCATHDEAEAAEGTVNHEEVASLHAEAAQVGGESVSGEDHA